MDETAAEPTGRENRTTVLLAALAGQQLAFKAADIGEVLRAVSVSPVPGAPSVIEGIIDVRGEVLPVLNLRRRFGIDPLPLNLTDRFLITDRATRRLAIRVDAVDSVAEVPDSELSSTDDLWSRGRRIAGVVRLSSGLALFADVRSFLSETEEIALAEALADRDRA